jgi:hypothetical protein
VLRNALELNHMRPIASVAATQLKQAPEFTALRLPPANSTVRQLIDRRESAAALKYAAIFTDAGLPGDFLAQLKDAAGAFNEGARAMEALCRASTRACEERVSFIVTL